MSASLKTPNSSRKSDRLKAGVSVSTYAKRSTPNKTTETYPSSDDTDSERDTLDTETVDTDIITNRQTVLFGDEDVAGSSVYTFKTPKKKDAMMAAVAVTPKTPKMTQTPKTPKSTSASTPKSSNKTPKTSVQRKLVIDDKNSKTPSHIRAATKRGRNFSIFVILLKNNCDI